jgi:hypothetical protein
LSSVTLLTRFSKIMGATLTGNGQEIMTDPNF